MVSACCLFNGDQVVSPGNVNFLAGSGMRGVDGRTEEMTPEQIDGAQKLALAWKPKPLAIGPSLHEGQLGAASRSVLIKHCLQVSRPLLSQTWPVQPPRLLHTQLHAKLVLSN